MLPLYHATGVLVPPKPQKSSHVFPFPKGEKEREKLLTLAYFSHMMHFDDALLDLHELLKNLLNNTRGKNHGRANVEGKTQY